MVAEETKKKKKRNNKKNGEKNKWRILFNGKIPHH